MLLSPLLEAFNLKLKRKLARKGCHFTFSIISWISNLFHNGLYEHMSKIIACLFRDTVHFVKLKEDIKVWVLKGSILLFIKSKILVSAKKLCVELEL